MRLLKAIKSRRENVLDGLGNRNILNRPGQLTTMLNASYGSDFLERSDHLFDKERIPFRFAVNQACEFVRQKIDAQYGPGYLCAMLCREWLQSQVRMIGSLAKWRGITGPIGQQEQYMACRDAIGNDLEKVLSRLIHPVDILQDDHSGGQLRGVEQDTLERAEKLVPAQFRVHPSHVLVSGV